MLYVGNDNVVNLFEERSLDVLAIFAGQAALVNYPRTPSNEAALDILVRGYEKLGMQKLADDSRRILQATYPESAYLAAAPAKPWWKLW